MRKFKIIPLLLAAALAASAAVGCSEKTDPDISRVSNSSSSADQGKLEGIADKEISVAVREKADANQTGFTLNKVVDSGMTDDNGAKYLYLDVSISNSTDKEYDLSILNNFYILLPNEEEMHFDVRTQLHATKNINDYVPSPFTIPANGEFSGLVGGFIVDKDISEFTVCFFPTQDDEKNKSSVVKVKVSNQDIVPLN